MLTKLTIRNFKMFDEVEIELDNPVLFIGPNNSGKTTALQALTLWELGLRRWLEKRKNNHAKKQSGVTINRRDLLTTPISNTYLLWRFLRVRKSDSNQKVENIRIEIIVEGITEKREKWECGLEFYFANPEFFYCRPIRVESGEEGKQKQIPEEVRGIHFTYIPAMSGITSNETRFELGSINVRIGEGRVSEVLRNLYYKIYVENYTLWLRLNQLIENLFVETELVEPLYIPERGEIEMKYRERGFTYDLPSSGSGFHQILFLLACMYLNPNAIFLIDEPDTHLEILRQKQVYDLISNVVRENKSQLIIASHSEGLLNVVSKENNLVVGFIGKPHQLIDRGSMHKILRDVELKDIYLAQQKGWILYLEGFSDLAILREFAIKLNHEEATKALELPFVYFVGDYPKKARDHYKVLVEAHPNTKGIAIFDKLPMGLSKDFNSENLVGFEWKKREIENYFCYPETLLNYAKSQGAIISEIESLNYERIMREVIQKSEEVQKFNEKPSPWDKSVKVSDDILPQILKNYLEKLGIQDQISKKKNFYELIAFMLIEKIDPEVKEKLDAIVEVAKSAEPFEDFNQDEKFKQR
jgi:hypothetical protein